MKNRKGYSLKIGIIMFCFLLFLLPISSFAHNFYCWGDDDNPKTCHVYYSDYYGNFMPYGSNDNNKSIAGVWHSMDKNRYEWLKSEPILASYYRGEDPENSPNRGGETYWGYTGLATVDNVGGLCYGHRYASGGKGWCKINTVIDTYDFKNEKVNDDVAEQFLGYAAYKSTINNETGRSPYHKNQIRKWLWDNYHNSEKYGGFIQNTDGNAREDYVTEEASEYVNSVSKEKFNTTTPDEGEKAKQIMQYKNGHTYIGPYNLSTEFGSLSQATIETRQNQSYTTTLCSIDGNTIQNLDSISNYKGNNFYIVIEGEQIESVKQIKLTKKMNIIASRIAIAETVSKGGQYIAVFCGQEIEKEKNLDLPGIPYTNLKLKKIDKESKEPLFGIGFIIYNEKSQKWVRDSETESAAAEYVDTKEQAKTYTTGMDGTITVKNLSKDGNYKIYEVVNPYLCYEEVSLENPKEVGNVEVSIGGGELPVQTIENKKLINIHIHKIDEDDKKPLEDVGFIVYNETERQWVRHGENLEGRAEYVDKEEEAQIYYTDEEGNLKISNLSKNGNYILYEVVNNHFGYKEVSRTDKDEKLKVQINIAEPDPETQTITNKRLYVRLSGYAWEDRPSGDKEAKLDDVYKENDRRLRNIKVTLKNANGEIIDTRTTNTITNTKNQEEQGAYLFGDYKRDPNAKKIEIEQLKGAYIEFEYNGMCYQTVGIDATTANANKVSENTRKSRQHFKGQLQ